MPILPLRAPRARLLVLVPLVALVTAALVPTASASRGTLDTGPLTAGTTTAATFRAASPDAQTVVFSTPEALVGSDTDDRNDLYVVRGTAAPALLTTGVTTLSGSPEFRPGTVTVLAGGDVAFVTANRLAGSAIDDDDATDLYLVRPDGTVVDVSDTPGTGDGANGVSDAYVVAAGGSALAFTSTEALTADDTQSSVQDVYRYAIGTGTPLALVTKGTGQGTAVGISADGARVYWESTVDQTPSQSDSGANDLYVAAAPFTTPRSPTVANNGDGSSGPGLYAGESPDGSTVVVRTPEKFDSTDTVGSPDLYALAPSGGQRWLTKAVPGSPAEGGGGLPAGLAACDDGTVVLTTAKRLAAADSDDGSDLYRVTPTSTTLVSGGAGTTLGVTPVAVAADCGRAAWVTAERDVPGDTDTTADLFLGDGTTTTQVTAVPPGGTDGAVSAPDSVATLGDRLFFTTTAVLGGGDKNSGADVYEVRPATGAVSLITGGHSGAPGDLALRAAGPASVVVSTAEKLSTSDTEFASDLYRYLVTDGAPDPFPASPSPPGPRPGPAGVVTPTTKAARAKVTKGKVTVSTQGTVRCAAPGAACSVLVQATRGKKALGSKTSTLAAGATQPVAVPLIKVGRRALAAKRRLAVTFTVLVTRAASVPVLATFTTKVKAPRAVRRRAT